MGSFVTEITLHTIGKSHVSTLKIHNQFNISPKITKQLGMSFHLLLATTKKIPLFQIAYLDSLRELTLDVAVKIGWAGLS